MINRKLLFVSVLSVSPTMAFLASSSPGGNIPFVKLSRETVRADRTTRTPTLLFEQEQESQRGSIRFSGADGLTTTTNPLDSFLSLVASDIASIALGLVGLLLVVIHRWSLLDASVDTLALQTRTDLLAVFACGSVLLNGITKLDVTAALAESVVLEGTRLELPEAALIDEASRTTTIWGLESLLAATPAKTAAVLTAESSGWKVLARAGTVPSSTEVPESTPILDRVGSPGNTKETYLPTLQALPGKREFPFLPANTQLALLIPMSGNQILVLGGNTAKSFTPRDIAWCRIVAERVGSGE